MHKASIILLICMLLVYSLPFAQVKVDNDPLNLMYKIGEEVEYLEDPSASLTIDDILSTDYQSKFVKQGHEVFSRPATPSVFWFKIKVQKKGNQYLWMDIGQANFTWYADFYAPNAKGEYLQPRLLGSLRPLKNKEFPANSYCVLLFDKEEQGNRTFYLRLEDHFAYTHVFQIGNSFAFIKYQAQRDFMTAWFIGLIAGMIVYNLFILYSTKEQVYVYYVLYLIWVVFAIPFHNGYVLIQAPWVWENFIVWNGISYLIMTLFVLNYFKEQIHLFKYFVYWIWLITILQTVIFPIVYIFNWEAFPDLINLTSVAAILHTFSLFILGVLVWGKRYRSARYYVFAWFFVILATAAFLLSVNGIIPLNYFTQNAFYFGFSSESLLFALALGDRLNILKREKELAQKENTKIIHQQNEVLEDKVLQRTKELQEANEEMQVINEELRQTQEELETQKDFLDERNKLLDRANQKNQNNLQVLHKQNKKLDLQNKKINSSMKAAETIQKAILPQKTKFQQFFQNSFIINQPRDVVSGDFYWLKKVKNKIILVVADCTGHGVPGAFMTLIGVNLLDKIVEELLIDRPADILFYLHQEVQMLLKQEETENNSGMDAVVVTLENHAEQMLLTFAGAKNSIYYFSEERLVELKGTRKSIGGLQNENIHFEEQKVVISSGDLIYLGSDGLEDQNDNKRKKFGKRRLQNLLKEIAQLPITEQKLNIEEALNRHKRQTEQRDDILWMGIKV